LQGLITFLKALAIVLLAAIGAGFVYSALCTYDPELQLDFGGFLFLGAIFLYREWFTRS
jgi:hypothetical protein